VGSVWLTSISVTDLCPTEGPYNEMHVRGEAKFSDNVCTAWQGSPSTVMPSANAEQAHRGYLQRLAQPGGSDLPPGDQASLLDWLHRTPDDHLRSFCRFQDWLTESHEPAQTLKRAMLPSRSNPDLCPGVAALIGKELFNIHSERALHGSGHQKLRSQDKLKRGFFIPIKIGTRWYHIPSEGGIRLGRWLEAILMGQIKTSISPKTIRADYLGEAWKVLAKDQWRACLADEGKSLKCFAEDLEPKKVSPGGDGSSAAKGARAVVDGARGEVQGGSTLLSARSQGLSTLAGRATADPFLSGRGALRDLPGGGWGPHSCAQWQPSEASSISAYGKREAGERPPGPERLSGLRHGGAAQETGQGGGGGPLAHPGEAPGLSCPGSGGEGGGRAGQPFENLKRVLAVAHLVSACGRTPLLPRPVVWLLGLCRLSS
jgi:hypothetical protein